MWFKQVQLYQLTDKIAYSPEKIAENMLAMAFTPCLASFPMSVGWVSPIDDEDAPLVHAANGCIMLCMQVEEKILPATVIRQALMEKIKKIEKRDDKKVKQKEKLSLKDEVIMDLLPRAFSKLTRVYAYIDTQNARLVLGTLNPVKTDQFITLFKRSFTEGFRAYELKKLSSVMTTWVKNKTSPKIFSIEESCLLQDPNHKNRTVRVQNQDLFATGVQAFLKDGSEVKQMALAWHDRVNFVLADEFSLRNIQFQDTIVAAATEIEAETKQQQYDADFFIMTQTFSGLFDDLLALFVEKNAIKTELSEAEA